MLRRIYIKHIKCSNDSSRLWWNWQFCGKKRSENWSRPIPSIGLGRQTTTTTYSVAGPGFGCTSSDIWRSRCMVWSGRLRSGLWLLYVLFNHPRLLIQVGRVQKAQFSSLMDGGRLLSTLLSFMLPIVVLTNEV